MFQHADRLPVETPPEPASSSARPWALRRMAPYPHTVDAGFAAVQIDPVTQIGAGPDGKPVLAKHKRSNTGTENKTKTSRGDGQNQGEDEDHSRDSDQD